MSNPDWWALCRDDWVKYLTPYRDQIKRVLEVGSWEGFSAVFWHRFFGASVWCIDNWENATLGREVAGKIEANFDANTNSNAFHKVKQHSTLALHDYAGGEFDLVYIDGDHHRNQVMVDSILGWRALRPGGIMIWDDWELYCPELPDAERPESAIRLFLGLVAGEWTELANTGRQLFIKKNES